MKTRTFTVLVTDEYDPANGVEMTDAEAIKELRDSLQASCDNGDLGGYFLIVKVEAGDAHFWSEWHKRLAKETP